MKNHLLQLQTLSALAAGLLTANLALADNELWIGNPGVTTTINWSDPANWSGPSHNPNNNSVFFGNGVAVGQPGLVNNVVDLSTNCYSLNYTNSIGWNTTLIAAGQTLTIVGNNSGPALLFTPGAQTSNTNVITGANGTLLITGSSAGGVTVTVTNSGSTGVHPLLDLSGLGTLIFSNAGSSAAINVGNSAVRPGGTLNLAMTNYINLPATGAGGSAAIVVGEATSNNGSSPGGALNLGITNTIFAGNIGVGLGKQSAATIAFNPAFLANNPVTYIRGPGGSAVTNWAIGDGTTSGGSSPTASGTVNFNGGTVNAVVNAMWLGRTCPTATTPTAKGTLSFNAGTISVVNLTNGCAVPLGTGGSAGAATGTINVTGTGLLSVSNLVLAYAGVGTSTGTLNITNGTVEANTIISGGGNSSINVMGGALFLTNTAGAVGQPLSSLYVSNATMQLNVSGSTAPSVVGTLSVDGTTNIINIASIPAVATFPTELPLIAYTSFSAVTGFNFGIGTLPGTYQGYFSNNTANSSVDLVITNSQFKTDTWNGNVNDNWDTATLNWRYTGLHVNYQQGDSVTFDDTLTGTPNVVLATNVQPFAISFNNSSLNYVLGGTSKITGTTGLTKQGSGSVTLTESGGDDFSGGITVNSGAVILDDANCTISGGLTINGGTVQIGNQDANGALPSGAVADNGALVFNRTDNVTVSTAIPGTGSLVQSGSGTLTLSGVNAYTGNTVVSGGTLALSGSGTIAFSAAVSVNSATFDVSALSQPTTLTSLTLSGANINVVPSGSAANIACSSLTLAAPANHINVVSLPPIASYPVTFTIIQSSSPASGTFNFNAPTVPGGYVANVTQSGDGMAVLLNVTSGPIGARPSVLWIGADVPNLNATWSDRLNWQLPGAPTFGDNVFFSPTAAQTGSALSSPGGGVSTLMPDYLDNIVDASFTISSLTFTNVNGSYHNTLIHDGLTLNITNSGSLTVGSGSLDFGSTATEFVTIAGTNGTLSVNNPSGTIYVGLGSANSGSHQAALDLSALGTFNANVSRLMVGVGSSSCGFPLPRESGIVYLAQTNTITASLAVSGTETSDTSGSAVAFGIGDNAGNAGNTSCLYLGQTNAIFADAICIARQKQSAQMLFNPALIGLGPSAWFRGQDGVSAVGIWSLGDGVVNGGSSGSTGVNDFTGGTVNALVNTMYVGRAANTATGSGTSIGTLAFDDGVFNVGTLYLGYQPANSAKAGVGTMNVNSNATAGAGATLVVSGTLNLGLTTGGPGAANTSGTLNITNGTVEANTILAGGGASTINLVGGTLMVTTTAGTTAAPLTALNLTTASLHLDVNPAANATNIVATTVGTSGTTTITIDSIGGFPASATFPLIKYTGSDPYANLSLNPSLPGGYTSGSLVDDTARQTIDLTVSAGPPAAPLIVTNTADSGPGSLRAAVANSASARSIAFATNLSGQTILLTSGQITLNQYFIIDASALPGGITINGNQGSRIFQVGSGVAVVLNSLTITNGIDTGGGNAGGGGILNYGTLTLNNCTLAGNSANQPAWGGGGILSYLGTLTLNQCTVAGNSAQGDMGGGGILNFNGTLTLNQCTVAGNSAASYGVGGGITVFGGSVTINNSIVAGNTAPTYANLYGSVTATGVNLTSGDPLLAPLGNYGGPTPTMPPLPGSPAIDGCISGTSFTTDQRGPGFPRIVGAYADIGAVESGNPIPALQVNTAVDKNDGLGTDGTSLRDALGYAPSGSTIVFAPALSGSTILLTNGQLTVSNSVSIVGPGPANLMINGNYASRVFNITGSNVTISGLTIANGYSTTLSGAGICSGGSRGSTLAINNCVVISNSSTLDGGGIYNSSGVTLTVSNCTIADNYANNGGGIYSTNARLTVVASTFSGNSAGGGGGIMNDGQNGASAMLTVNVSTFSINMGYLGGGGILNWGQYGSATLELNASTFSGNSAGGSGGGALFNNGAGGTGLIEIADCILSAGTSGGNIYNYSGTVTSDGYNLSSDGGGGFLTGTGDQINTDPKLGPLQNNGGPTWTCALLPGSPAIDQGKANAIPGLGLTTDQRGFPRPVDFAGIPNAPGGDGSDIGAFEAQIVPGGSPLWLTGATKSGSGSFQFAFTNTPGAGFTVFTTTNVALPFSDWTVLGVPIEIAPGQFQFTDAQATNSPQRFYRVTSP